MGERTLVHAFTDGRDVSPHAAAARPRASCSRGRPDRDRRRPLLRDGPRPALGADRARARGDRRRPRATHASDPVARSSRATTRGVTDEFLEPVVLRGARGSSAGGRGRSSSTSGPTGRASSHERLLDAGIDLTTMTRYRDDLDCPVAFEEQDVADTIAEVLAAHGVAPAPRRRDREVRARHVLPQRRPRAGVAGRDADPRPVAAGGRDLRPEARDVRARGRRALRRRDRRRLRLRDRQLREPRHGRAHGRRSRRSSQAVEAIDACLGRVVEAVEAPDGVCLVIADHGNAEQLLEARRRQPAHGAHDEPGAARRHVGGLPLARRRRARRPRADLPGAARDRPAAGDDGSKPRVGGVIASCSNTRAVVYSRRSCDTAPRASLLRATASARALDSSAKRSGATRARSRSLVTAYETPVFNYILRIVGDRTLAEDLTQDVFLRVYHGLAGLLAALPVHDLALPGGEEPGARRAARPRAPAAPGRARRRRPARGRRRTAGARSR